MRDARTRRVIVATVFAVLSVLGVLSACQAPTQIILHIRTNVQCERESPTPIVSVGRIDRPDDEAPLASTHIDCRSGGEVGTLVITPSSTDERSSAIGIRVAMRYAKDRDPERDTGDCTRASAAFCIVQRRIVAFREHETLDLPIDLNVSCKGLYCSALETCNRANQCVSAECTDGTCEAVAASGGPDTDGGAPDANTSDGNASDGNGSEGGPGGDGGTGDGSSGDGSKGDAGGVAACEACNVLTDTCCANTAAKTVRCVQKPAPCEAQETTYICWTKTPCQQGCCGTTGAAPTTFSCRAPGTCTTTACATAAECTSPPVCLYSPVFSPTGTCPGG